MARLEDCIVDASDEIGISKTDARQIADRVKEFRDQKKFERRSASIDDKVREFANNEADKMKKLAAQKRKQEALNIMVRRRLHNHVDGLMSEGMDERKAIQTFLVGSVKGMANARKSVHGRRVAIEDEWMDGMWREMKRDKPHLAKLITKGNPALMSDVAAEMWQIKPKGKKGITGNKDAEYLADLLARYMEMARLRMNDAGAFIGKIELNGYIPQHHDGVKVSKKGFKQWRAQTEPLIDMPRTFGNRSGKSLDRAWEEIYQNIVTGRDRELTGKEETGRTSPANIADQLNQHRVLHFSGSDGWMKYQADFGHGNAVTAAMNHLHQSARTVSLMETMGPNPKNMMTSFIEERTRRVRDDDTLDGEQKKARMDALGANLDNPTSSRIANAFAQVSGDTISPGSSVWAKRTQAVRSWISMAKLGAATLSAVPTDVASMAAELRFQGKGAGSALGTAIKAGFKGRSAVEQSEVSALVETGFEQVFGEINARYLADDLVPGRTAAAVEMFFRWTGMTGWTISRRSAFQVISSQHFADNTKHDWGGLPPKFQHLLGLHGIDENVWSVARKMVKTDGNGKTFMVPELARDVSDADIDKLIADDLATSRKHLEDDNLATREGQIRAQGRRDLEAQLRGYLVDEAEFGVLNLEDADRMITNAGTKPGTFVGEIVRFVMQLKGFPAGFTRKVLGRGFQGGIKKREGALARTDFGQVGFMLAAMTLAGYVAMTMKDVTKGRTARDPTREATWLAALMQGGGLGIFGDFMFGHANRFGNAPLETVAGPALGEAATLLENLMLLRDGESKGADWFRQFIQNVPGANIFYLRAALDYLVLRHIEEAMSPGVGARRERRMEEQFGQQFLLPR